MISIRPAYRPGRGVPHAPPAVIAPLALFSALIIAVFGAAYQLQSCSTANAAAPRMTTPTVFVPTQAHAPAPAPAPAHPTPRAHAPRTTA